METIKKGVHDADAEARSVARKYVTTSIFLLNINMLHHKCPDVVGFLPLQVLLEFPQSLPSGGGATLPGPGVVLSESSAGSPEERRQSDVAARLRSLLLVLAGEPQVRHLLLSPIQTALNVK